jgi:Icc-related predicted phosphoesterase
MNQENKKLRIAAVGDLHGSEVAGLHREFFQGVAKNADILLLCGDLSNHGYPKEAENLAGDLRGLKIPILAVLGNHDFESGNTEEFKRILTEAGVKFLEDEPYETRGIGFAGVKGFAGGFGKYMLAPFGEPAVKEFVSETVRETLKLENQLHVLETQKKVVMLHYAPIPETIKGEPLEIYPYLGSSRLIETIERFGVDVIFHGHAHHGTHQALTKKGVPVYNCTYHMMKQINPKQPYVLVEL